MNSSASARALAAPSSERAPLSAAALIVAGETLLADLARGQRIDAPRLRAAMIAAFGASDSDGAWTWKDAYEACEAAQTLFLRKFGRAMHTRASAPGAMLAMLAKLSALPPSQTRRSEESQALQQFSTPIGLGFVASLAARMTPDDIVLEPSAGTGLLAIFAELAGARVILNELAETRADMLAHLFPAAPLTRFDAAHIHDHLDEIQRPSVALMNPPFSAAAHVEGRVADAALKHVSSALARLIEGGRLVAITGAACAPDNPAWRDAFVRLQKCGRVVFSAPIDGRIYARHGAAVDTRLTIIDRIPADDPQLFQPSPGHAEDLATLLAWVIEHVPPRAPLQAQPSIRAVAHEAEGNRRAPTQLSTGAALRSAAAPEGAELVYETIDWAPRQGERLNDALYEPYALQSIRIAGARTHPTLLVQSAAMASVAPPKPSYKPHLPARVVEEGLLSDAQLESVIYASEAHSAYLDGSWTTDATFDNLAAAPEDAEGAFRFRRGWFLGDGTGAGKGRQVAGVLLDNWLKGRRRALWISKSDKLIEDAQRDWSALAQERLLVTPLSRFRPNQPIRLDEAILFTTYATLRSEDRGASRLQQILDWLGRDFDGIIVFDESHAMANAAGEKGERGDKAPSLQGRAGLRLQHALPDARVLYVSATGATGVANLAYAQRLGLWGGADFPFATRAEFVEAIEAGGVAAMEVLARDLKALGLYAARSLSYEGVRYELVEHRLTDEQIRIYDSYAGGFEIIHNNLDQALEAANVTDSGDALNRQAKSAARSAFESAKQRFFNHLITAMKTPTLIRAIERDLADGHAAIIQLVSTGEALMERRLSEISTEEWSDLQIDVTPRESVLMYLQHGFPVQLYEQFTDEDGHLSSRPVVDKDGQPVLCREAVERRDRLIEKLASLPPVHGALDQIVQHFGTDVVAEVTGRARRIVRKSLPRTGSGDDRLLVESRAGSANLAEAAAFMDDQKRILVFSDAGGTGRSYHADLAAKNQRLRVHYLLEAGWRADAAIQGLGRSNRTNQAQAPLFRPIATDVKAEKRFLSTIARRLDTLGAITKGQRQTGGQGLFRADDNLESPYGRAALRQLYVLIFQGKIEDCSLTRFQDATGLKLVDRDGSLREELPPITTFLNRLLALPIALQNTLFSAFENLLSTRIEAAIASGAYDSGLETIVAESLRIAERRSLYTHGSGAETQLLTIARRDRNHPLSLAEALARVGEPRARLLVNERSHRAAVQIPAPSLMLDDGSVETRVRLVRPMERTSIALDALTETHWREAERSAFAQAWEAEIAQIPEFTDSTLHIVTGLLLPIWKRLPRDSLRVFRLQTDDCERVIGRLVSPAWVSEATHSETFSLAPEDARRALLGGKHVLYLQDGLALRRVKIMGADRIELTGFTDFMVDRLKSMGLMSEIISWRLRLFVPMGADADSLRALMERHPPVRLTDRSAP